MFTKHLFLFFSAGIFCTTDIEAQTPNCVRANSIGISTGYNYNTNSLYGDDATDEKWHVASYEVDSHPVPFATNARVTDPQTIPSDQYNRFWLVSPQARWISAFRHGSNPTPKNNVAITYERSFSTCTETHLNFDIELASQEMITDFRLDGVSIPELADGQTCDDSQPRFFNFVHRTHFMPNVPSGLHTISVKVCNPYNGLESESSTTGLCLKGTISSGYSYALVPNTASPLCICTSYIPVCNADFSCKLNTALPNTLQVDLLHPSPVHASVVDWGDGTSSPVTGPTLHTYANTFSNNLNPYLRVYSSDPATTSCDAFMSMCVAKPDLLNTAELQQNAVGSACGLDFTATFYTSSSTYSNMVLNCNAPSHPYLSGLHWRIRDEDVGHPGTSFEAAPNTPFIFPFNNFHNYVIELVEDMTTGVPPLTPPVACSKKLRVCPRPPYPVYARKAQPDAADSTPDPQELYVFPNPASDRVSIEYFNKDASTASVSITNMIGAVVYRADQPAATKGRTKLQLLLSDYANGLYRLTLTHNGAIESASFLVQH